jgi:hypothetical protein
MEELKLKILNFVFFYRDCGVVSPLYMYEALSFDDDGGDDGVVSVISSLSIGYRCITA